MNVYMYIICICIRTVHVASGGFGHITSSADSGQLGGCAQPQRIARAMRRAGPCDSVRQTLRRKHIKH